VLTVFFVLKTKSSKPAAIDFWATWCGPCRFISPVFEKISDKAEFVDKVEFYKVDVDALPDIAQEAGITAVYLSS
jgi:thioredoxin 1